jgi:hypothetical protein
MTAGKDGQGESQREGIRRSEEGRGERASKKGDNRDSVREGRKRG